MDCDREKFAIGKGRIWPKKHCMDRPWGVWAYIFFIYLYIYIFIYIYIIFEVWDAVGRGKVGVEVVAGEGNLLKCKSGHKR